MRSAPRARRQKYAGARSSLGPAVRDRGAPSRTTWAVEVSAGAEKDLKRLPRDRRVRVVQAIDEMEENPLAGDVKPLKGPQWKGRFRKRAGDYRIIFTMDHNARQVEISAILIRSEKTYR